VSVYCLGVVVLLTLAVLWVAHRRAERLWAEQLIRDFERAFPGRCAVCAHMRYGVREGHATPGSPTPTHRDCPEGWPLGGRPKD
jgi:hypothetical protein